MKKFRKPIQTDSRKLGFRENREAPALNKGFPVFAAIVLACACLVPVLTAFHIDKPIDDAYITMTYARSLAQGHGFRIFPTVAPSLGTTSPLTAIVLALLSRLVPSSVEMASLAVGLSTLAWIATGWLWAFRGNVLGLNPLEQFCIAFLVLVETTLWTLYMGMEAHLFCFLLTLCIILYFQQRYFRMGLTIGLLFLTRIEGILVPFAFLAYQLISDPKRFDPGKWTDSLKKMFRVFQGFLIPFFLWSLYALFTVGTIFPHTLKAKSLQTDLGFAEPFSRIVLKLFSVYWSNLGFIGSVCIWLIAAVFGFGYSVVFRRRMLVPALWTIGFVIGYILLKAPGYHWYLLPLMYTVTVFAALAVASFPTLLEAASPFFPVIQKPRFWGTLTSLVLLSVVSFSIVPRNIPKEPIVADCYDDYKRLADWINVNTPVDTTVAFTEIGFLSWYADREIVDLLGLTRPDILPQLAEGGFAGVFQKTKPDYLIYTPPFGWALNDIVRSDFFITNYLPVIRIPSTRFRDFSYLIYERGQPAIPDARPEDYSFDFTSPQIVFHGFKDVSLQEDGSFSAQCETDPFAYRNGINLSASDYTHIVLTMSVPESVRERTFQIFYTSDNSTDFDKARSMEFSMISGKEMHTYVIPTSILPGWEGRLHGLKLDPVPNGAPNDDNVVVIKSFRLVHADRSDQ